VPDLLLPLFVKLSGRDVLVVGGGAMASVRAAQLHEAGARVTVVAPEVREDVARCAAQVHRRGFEERDLDGKWLAIAAATPEVNRAVAAAAEPRRVLVNAVDDPSNATAYTAGLVRRGDATVAVSTGGKAPALAGLLREALEALLPDDVARWVETAEAARDGWKRARIPLATRRPLLLEKLNALYAARTSPDAGATGMALPPHPDPRASAAPASPPPVAGRSPAPPAPRGGGEGRPGGHVSLVGAGPGDPGLLTRRGADALAAADVVLYDALVDPAVLALAPRAHCFFVGKRGGRASVSQRAIERLLVRQARRGLRVVRLKCGDPFVLGRGGEEALALAAAGVPFEVVPGVTSAVAAPALAGIPVTHRGLAAGFAVVSGHGEAAGPLLDALAPGALTLVVLMGVGRRAEIAARLAARGWDPATPAAIVLGGSTARAHAWRGTLAGLGAAALPPAADGLPGTLVMGEVAALACAAPAATGENPSYRMGVQSSA
jgi:uroporphyrin-III C-methyltransferase/precorrin-2 dehydrogenase/sirohydrochlorin ferrochelatase